MPATKMLCDDVGGACRLGKLKLTPSGVLARDDRVYAAAADANTKLVVTMGGGYPRDLAVGSDAYVKLCSPTTDNTKI